LSRSRRRTPIFGNTTCHSEKKDKQLYHKALRKRSKQALRQGKEMPHHNEVADVWDFGKDGKHYWDKATPLDMAK